MKRLAIMEVSLEQKSFLKDEFVGNKEKYIFTSLIPT
jgi:hypothetical protein